MSNSNIPFQTIEWNNIPKTEHADETGTAFWQTKQFGGLRVRVVEYSENYKADHWCEKGHVVPCIERNAIGAQKAIVAASLALKGDGTHRVSLDEAIETMWQTGKDMSNKYKETSRGGLAVNVAQC